jgi:hypothetical protein
MIVTGLTRYFGFSNSSGSSKLNSFNILYL